ncbi:MAG: TAT-variant-translocated molybdopterin oxidoreductase, partial [Opitutaceae bacterium]|nr:TAT-variant-translocated molybdopterin oxidoreductase [Opitutaceae bacterium]
MERIFQHPKPSKAEETGPNYWRSLDELAQTPKFKEYVDREFPEGASDFNEVDRRHFFKIMAASFAVGGLAVSGCRRPESHILPYSESPENIIPGVPVYYATSMPLREGAIPLLVETHQGRPTKIEGNPSYAPYGGSTTGIAQASVLDLYDPDRSTAHLKGGNPVSSEDIATLLSKISVRYTESKGSGLA